MRFIRKSLAVALSLTLLSQPARSVLVVVRRLRALSCPTATPSTPSSCARAPPRCEEQQSSTTSSPTAPCAGLAVLKVPRTGSTWLTKELRAFGAGVQLEFEPFTDASAHQCQGRFYTQALSKALVQRLRCVTRESRSLPCYWGWVGCNATRLKPRPTAIKAVGVRPGGVLTGFLINPMYAPGAIWNRVLSLQPRAKLVWLRRTNLVKMALSDLRRLAGASARQARSSVDTSAAFVEPRTLLVRLNMTLVTQATFPAAVSLDRGYLLLYEDLQTHRLLVLTDLLRASILSSIGK